MYHGEHITTLDGCSVVQYFYVLYIIAEHRLAIDQEWSTGNDQIEAGCVELQPLG